MTNIICVQNINDCFPLPLSCAHYFSSLLFWGPSFPCQVTIGKDLAPPLRGEGSSQNQKRSSSTFLVLTLKDLSVRRRVFRHLIPQTGKSFCGFGENNGVGTPGRLLRSFILFSSISLVPGALREPVVMSECSCLLVREDSPPASVGFRDSPLFPQTWLSSQLSHKDNSYSVDMKCPPRTHM